MSAAAEPSDGLYSVVSPSGPLRSSVDPSLFVRLEMLEKMERRVVNDAEEEEEGCRTGSMLGFGTHFGPRKESLRSLRDC